jgi:hypothetical protein
MEKVLQILAVFVLLMLLIWRSIRGREERFRRFSFLGRVKAPAPEVVRLRLVVGVFESMERSGIVGEREAYGVPEGVDAFLWDEDSGLLLFYRVDGKLAVCRRTAGGRNRELQELAVPMDCTGLAWDPVERKIYLEEAGDWFVYGEEG